MAGDQFAPVVSSPVTAGRGRRTALLQRVKGMHEGLVALADQTLVSGVNFATGLVLARYLSQASFGYYVLVFSVLLFVNGLQSALITAPMMVLAPRYGPSQTAQYINSLWVVQLAGYLVLAVAVTALLLSARPWLPTGLMESGVGGLVLVLLAYLAQEFVRRLLFVRHFNLSALIADLISYGLQLGAIVVLIARQQLSLGTVIWAIGLTSLLSCVFGIIRLAPAPAAVSRADLYATCRNQWEHGRWLLRSTIAQWSSNQIYLFVAASLLSVSATATLAASRNLLGLTNIMMLSLENFVPSTVTRQFLAGGIEAVVRWTRRFRLVLGLTMGAYCVAVAIFAGPLMRLLFGPEYGNTETVVRLMSLCYLLMALKTPSIIALRALSEPRWVFYSFLASSLVTVTISGPLVLWRGLVGATIGMIVTQVILLVILSYAYWKVVGRHRAEALTQHTTEQRSLDPMVV